MSGSGARARTRLAARAEGVPVEPGRPGRGIPAAGAAPGGGAAAGAGEATRGDGATSPTGPGRFFRAVVEVDLRPGSLDAQGEAVRSALWAMGFGEVAAVRVGKRIELELAAPTAAAAEARVRTMAERLLANPVLEVFRVRVKPATARPEATPGPAGAAWAAGPTPGPVPAAPAGSGRGRGRAGPRRRARGAAGG